MSQKKMQAFLGELDDPLYDDVLDTMAEENKQQQLASYVPVGVDDSIVAIQSESEKFIKNIVKLYHKAGKKNDDLYFDSDDREAVNKELDDAIQSISAIETVTMSMLLKQVKFGGHLVDSLMRRFESGGSMDNDLVDKIMSAQQNALNLILTITSHIRNLPLYFKNLESDLSKEAIGSGDGDNLNFDSPTMLQIEETSSIQSGPTEFDVAKPQKGMKDMIRNAQKARLEVQKDFGDSIDFEEVD